MLAMAGIEQLERGRPVSLQELRGAANWIRLQTIELTEIAGSGHYASTFSCAELLAVLYYHALRLRPGEPALARPRPLPARQGPRRDRRVPVPRRPRATSRPVARRLHPARQPARRPPRHDQGAGHRLQLGVDRPQPVGRGRAWRCRRACAAATTGCSCCWATASCNEGQVWEAAMAAAHFRLGNLVAIVDANGTSLDGPVAEVMGIEPIADKWRGVRLAGRRARRPRRGRARATGSPTCRRPSRRSRPCSSPAR